MNRIRSLSIGLSSAVAALAIATAAWAPITSAVVLTVDEASVMGNATAGTDVAPAYTLDSPPSVLPLSGDTAAASLDGDSAFSFALVEEPAFLSASAGAEGILDDAFADALAAFSATIVSPSSALSLFVSLDSVATLLGLDGLFDVELGYTVTSAGVTLLDERVALMGAHSVGDLLMHDFELAPGAEGTLDAFLRIDAMAGAGTFVEGVTSASFELAERDAGVVVANAPGALLLVLTAAIALIVRRPRNVA